MRVVELPINASEDRVVGTIDLEAALKEGSRRFEPGVLAEANRNILYVDEVNLLDDHIVDVLLDAAAMGINTVEREGVSVSHPSRFILVGTMNPEEGELRPQLLDRFGLCVDVEGIRDLDQRVAIVEKRALWEDDPNQFSQLHAESEQAAKSQIAEAIATFPEVMLPPEILRLIAQISIAHDVDAVMALMTDDCVFENTLPPPDGERHVGQTDMRRFWQTFFDGTPQARFETEEMVVAGDRAVVRWRFDWGSGHVRGIDLFKVRDGKVAEKLSYVKG